MSFLRWSQHEPIGLLHLIHNISMQIGTKQPWKSQDQDPKKNSRLQSGTVRILEICQVISRQRKLWKWRVFTAECVMKGQLERVLINHFAERLSSLNNLGKTMLTQNCSRCLTFSHDCNTYLMGFEAQSSDIFERTLWVLLTRTHAWEISHWWSLHCHRKF